VCRPPPTQYSVVAAATRQSANGFAQDAAGNVVGFVGSTPPPGFTVLKKAPN